MIHLLGLLAFSLAAVQDANPAPAPEAASGQHDQILYEKWRYERDGMVTIYYRVGHARGRILKALLEGTAVPATPPAVCPVVSGEPRGRVLSAKGWANESEAMHLLIVSDAKENIGFIEAVLKVLDIPDPQVMIEAKVVEIRWDHDMQIGIEGDGAASPVWIQDAGAGSFLREVRAKFNPTEAINGGPFQGSTFRFNRASSNKKGTIGGIIQAFVERGRGEVLSSPRIMVESGDQATVKVGDEIPFTETILHPGGQTTTVKYKTTGITLMVKPHIVGAASVNLDLNLEVGALLGFVNLPTGTAPTFTTRSATTHVTVRDGEEIVIGGLRSKERHTLRRGLPFISDIPIVGSLFGRNEETETVQEIIFFIRPVIIQGGTEMPRTLIDPARK